MKTDGRADRRTATLLFAGVLSKARIHDADTDTDILGDILARIVARMSACSSACHGNIFRKSRVSDVSARMLARMSVSLSVSASWNSSLRARKQRRRSHYAEIRGGACVRSVNDAFAFSEFDCSADVAFRRVSVRSVNDF